MNTVVIYKSKYGSTKRYAEWIASELNCPIYEYSNITTANLYQYDLVIYGGGLYAGMIDGVSLVTKNPCKQLIIFTVGLSNPTVTDYTETINSIPKELRTHTKFFHLRGGLDYTKLKFLHKIGMNVMKTMLKKKPPEKLTDNDKEILRAFEKKVDFTDKTTIEPIIEHVRVRNI